MPWGAAGSGSGAPGEYTLGPAASGDVTGVTDTTNINKAINALIAKGGGVLVFPQGHYYTTGLSYVITPPPFVQLALRGQGLTTVIENVSASGADTLLITQGGSGYDPGQAWLEVSDMSFIGHAAAGNGISLSAVFNATLTNIFASGFSSTNKAGINLGGALGITIINPLLFNNYNGILTSGNANTVIGGWIEFNTVGVWVVGGLEGTNNNFYGTIIEGNANGIFLQSPGSGVSTYGCWFESNGAYHVQNEGQWMDYGSMFSGTGPIVLHQSNAVCTRMTNPVFSNNPPTVTIIAGATGPCEIIGANGNAGNDLTLANITDGSNPTCLILRDCKGINPIGATTPAVPASGTAVAAVAYDRTFYINGDAVDTVNIATAAPVYAATAGPTLTIAVGATNVAVFVPAGATLTPTYTAGHPPTWHVMGH